MKTHNYPPASDWKNILARPSIDTSQLEASVSDILHTIKNEGDEAIRRYTVQFDKIKLDNFELSPQEIEAAIRQVDDGLKTAIQTAKNH
jgi:histidinol dehydrogenase